MGFACNPETSGTTFRCKRGGEAPAGTAALDPGGGSIDMSTQYLDLADDLSRATSTDEVREAAARQMERLGIHTLTWAGGLFSPAYRRYFSTFDNRMVEDRFRQIEADPCGSPAWHALQRRDLRPDPWGVSVPRLQPKDRAFREFCELVAGYGCTANINVPIWRSHPRDFGTVTFSVAMTGKEFEAYFPYHASLIAASAMLISARMTVLSSSGGEASALLSGRERECLLWLASGLRYDGIADRLGISEWTVMFHLKNARTKLGAATNEQALAKAILQGAISP
jgi:DNA-binding CsgD family transcriptional regulator